MATASPMHLRRARRELALWAGVLAGPLAWLLQLLVAYAMVPWACAGGGDRLPLHLATLGALAVAAAGAAAAWRSGRRAPGEELAGNGSRASRQRFMALAGLALSALFFLVIAATGFPSLLLGPCD